LVCALVFEMVCALVFAGCGIDEECCDTRLACRDAYTVVHSQHRVHCSACRDAESALQCTVLCHAATALVRHVRALEHLCLASSSCVASTSSYTSGHVPRNSSPRLERKVRTDMVEP